MGAYFTPGRLKGDRQVSISAGKRNSLAGMECLVCVIKRNRVVIRGAWV